MKNGRMFRFLLLLLLLLTTAVTVTANPTVAYASVPKAPSYFTGQTTANWALNNVYSPSAPGYHDYSSEGGDCTNFVSHALYQGGLQMVGLGTNSKSTSVWWQRSLSWFDEYILRKDRNSYTWTFADQLGIYLTNSGKGYIVQVLYRVSPSPTPFKVGDIVQISTSRYVNNAHHSMIVTSVSSSGVLVTYRNSSGNPVAKNAKLQDLIYKYPNEYFIQIRIR